MLNSNDAFTSDKLLLIKGKMLRIKGHFGVHTIHMQSNKLMRFKKSPKEDFYLQWFATADIITTAQLVLHKKNSPTVFISLFPYYFGLYTKTWYYLILSQQFLAYCCNVLILPILLNFLKCFFPCKQSCWIKLWLLIDKVLDKSWTSEFLI